MKDPIRVVRKVLDFAGLDAGAETMEVMRDYQRAHPRAKFGCVIYRYEDVGLDPVDLRRKASRYLEAFQVHPEVDAVGEGA